MPVPLYITDENVFFNETLTPSAVLLTGPPVILVRFDTMDLQDKARLAVLVTANGGTLPLSSINVAYNTILDNGKSWWDTYASLTITPDRQNLLPGPGGLTTALFWDGTDWRFDYNGAIVP